METEFRYKAFISYSHSDEEWAKWLHRALETYRVPKHLVGRETEFGPVPARIAPGQTAAQVMEHARNATKDLEVDLAWEGRAYDPPPVSSDDSDAYRLIAALASDGGKLPVAPGLVTATTDSRALAGIADNIYRFSPMVASMRDFEMIHGTNEHMTLENLGRMTGFYSRLIATAAR